MQLSNLFDKTHNTPFELNLTTFVTQAIFFTEIEMFWTTLSIFHKSE